MANVKKYREVADRILHAGSYLEKEAYEMGVTLEELLRELEKIYSGGKKNSQFKAVLRNSMMNSSRVSEEELTRMRVLPKPAPAPALAQTPAPAPAPALAQTLAPAQAPAPDTMEELLRKKEELQKQVMDYVSSLEDAEEILQIRQEALVNAQSVLEKAQLAVQQATTQFHYAREQLHQAQEHQKQVQKKLQRIEEEIFELKEQTVYLIEPWYSGTLPEYGTFISTVEMEGVQILEPTETIEPDFKDMVSAGFD